MLGHGVGESSEVGSVLVELLPGFGAGLDELVKVFAGGHVGDDLLQLGPAVLNGI